MSVDQVLEKISAHNTGVMGCIATRGERLYHNLPELYELLDARDLSEYAQNMFDVTDDLETDHPAFDQLFLEFEGHSVYARRLEGGVLVLLNEPVDRADFKRVQVGVNLFMKPLTRALLNDDSAPVEAKAPQPASQPEPEPTETPARRRWF